MERRCLRTVVSISLIVFGAGIARSDDDADMHIFKALDEPTRIIFKDTPLHDAFVYLSSLHDIRIRLDTPALEKVGISVDTPVTATRVNVPLRKALSDILGPYNLSFMIKDNVLTVTTTRAAEKWQKKYAERLK